MTESLALSKWFGMSRASFAILPRVVMADMPEEWQNKFAALVSELDGAYPNQDLNVNMRVQLVHDSGKYMKMDDFYTNYRYPDRSVLEKMKEPLF